MPLNLVKRRQLWVARLQVPKDAQPALGNRKVLSRSTGEADLAQARVVAAPILAGWKADIQAVRAGNAPSAHRRVLEFAEAFQRTRATGEGAEVAEAAIRWMLERSGVRFDDAL